MKIILFETIDEVTACVSAQGKDSLTAEDTRIVSLDPKVESFLKEQGVRCENTLPFFDNQSHKAIVEKVERIVGRIDRDVHFRDRNGIERTYSHFLIYHIKFYMNYFLMNIEILHNICRKYEVEEIIYCSSEDNRNNVAPQAFIDGGEYFLGDIIRQFCRGKGIQSRCQYIKITTNKRIPWFNIERLSSFFIGIYFYLYWAIIKKRVSSLNSAVVIPTWGYKFDDLIHEFRKRFPQSTTILILEGKGDFKQKLLFSLISLAKFIPLPSKYKVADFVIPVSMLASHAKKGQQGIFDSEFIQLVDMIRHDLADELIYHDVNTMEILLQKIHKGLAPEMKDLCRNTNRLKEILEKINPGLIVSPFSTGFYYALGEISRLSNMNSCIITHGTHVPPNNQYERIENYWLARGVVLNEYKTVALQTPWLDKFLNFYNDNRQRLTTGPLIFSRKKSPAVIAEKKKEMLGLNANKKVLLYATTQKTQHCNRFYITETLDEFVDSLKDIISAVNQAKDLYLIIRPHPICQLTLSDFKRLLPESDRFTVVKGGKFEDILSISDLLVSYSSTCIEEALANGMPVILYDKWRRYNHYNIPEMRTEGNIPADPVNYITNAENLGYYLQQYSQSGSHQYNAKSLEPYQYSWDCNQNFYDYVGSCLNGGRN